MDGKGKCRGLKPTLVQTLPSLIEMRTFLAFAVLEWFAWPRVYRKGVYSTKKKKKKKKKVTIEPFQAFCCWWNFNLNGVRRWRGTDGTGQAKATPDRCAGGLHSNHTRSASALAPED